MKKFYEIKAKGKSEADVFIYGDIGASYWDDNSVTAAQLVKDLQILDVQTINVRINSYGGSVSEGLAIYNALQRHPATVNTYVDGVAVSCASLIAMAGATMTMADNSMLMIHGPMAMAAGNANTMREMADVLDKYAQAMATSYAAKTGKPVTEMVALLTDGVDHWYTATEAKAARFADEVSAAVAVEARFDLGRYRGIPAAAAAFTRSTAMTPEQIAAAKAAEDAAAAAQAKATKDAADAAAAAAAKAAAGGAPTVVATNGRTKEQIAEIRAAFQPFMKQDKISAEYQRILEDPAITVEQARAQLLVVLGAGASPANPQGAHVQMGDSETDKFRAAASEAIIARAGLATADAKAKLGQNPYRGHKLLDICRASLERIGFNTRGMSQMEIVAAGFTQGTSDFPVLLENTMHKALLGAYALVPFTWKRFCIPGTVSDFRPSNRYRLGSFGNLDSKNELGEFKNKSIPDGEKSFISVGTKGNIINLSREAVINDDLGAFVGLAAMLGQAAGRSVETDVYALLAENGGAGPTMSDGFALFSTEHANNAAVVSVPSVVSVDLGRQAMASQRDISGNDFLDLRPTIWVGPLTTGGTMRVINAAQYDPDTANKLQRPNMVANLFKDIVDSPRITTADWYMFADPNIAPVIEVAFLDGNDAPFIELQNGFEVDGAKYKVRLDYGVKERDYRGAYRNAGD